jgi:uncharacterized protein YkwD
VAPDVAIPKLAPAKKNVLAPDTKELKQVVTARPSDNLVNLTRQGVILQTNKQRLALDGAGSALRENLLLDQAAESKIDDMLAKQYFDHISPSGVGPSDIVERAGYEFIATGENLAMGYYNGDAGLVQAWMDSPGHRENILKRGYQEIGVAVRRGTFNGGLTWLAVQEFGTPKSACPAVDNNISAKIDADKESLDQFEKNLEMLSQKIDVQKASIQKMEDELDAMVSSGAPGDAIEAKQQQTNNAIAQSNNDVNGYNDASRQMSGLYDNYKSEIEEYNAQINAFNNCLAGFN